MTAATSLSLRKPFPRRRAAEALRDQVRDYLVRTSLPVGEVLTTDAELVSMTDLSRSTVRRAMDDLRREGWIERRNGQGTFVGPRAALQLHDSSQMPHSSGKSSHTTRADMSTRALKLMLACPPLSAPSAFSHWRAGQMLAGMMEPELPGGRPRLEVFSVHPQDEPRKVAQRLAEADPDVLVILMRTHLDGYLIGEARTLGIPCITVNAHRPDHDHLNVPNVYDDGKQGIASAVSHLVKLGHTRIGYIHPDKVSQWAHDRREGYLLGLYENHLAEDQNLICWVQPGETESDIAKVHAYLERRKPTAVICGSWASVYPLGGLVREGKLRVPQDLSVIVYDQAPIVREWLGVTPTTIAQRLVEIGRRAVELANAVHHQERGRSTESFADTIAVPCDLVQGESVRSVPTDAEAAPHTDE